MSVIVHNTAGSGGSSVIIDGTEFKGTLELITSFLPTDYIGDLPYNFVQGSAVIYNNEIHILGSTDSSTVYKYHYKWDGSAWTSVSTLPYRFYRSSAVVHNNEIHILGSASSATKYDYRKYHSTTFRSCHYEVKASGY